MGLMFRRFRAVLVPLGFATLLHAAPILRLATSTVVSVPLPAGASGGMHIVEAYNAGDGSLALNNPTSSVSWISTSYGPSQACTTTNASATCIPLQLTLNTSALAAGTYTGSVIVSGASNIVDAPQTIMVTVRIFAQPGGLSAYVAPGSSSDVPFTTYKPVNANLSTQDGGRWLSLVLDGTGSFRFTYTYRIHLAPLATMGPGIYHGSLATLGSNFAPDNQTIPLTMSVTTLPIAQPYPAQITTRAVQGTAPAAAQISLNNAGQGSITLGTPTAMTTDGGTWLTATLNSGGWADIKLDPGSLAPGFYSGSVSMTSNAINGTVGVPVSFQVVAKGAPYAYYTGVVDNAIFGVDGGPVAPGDIVALFGEQLSYSGLSAASSVPLPAQLGGATVLVNGRAAPLYFTSYGQIDLQIPLETSGGTAQVQVQRDGLTGNTVSVQVASRAPRLLLVNGTGYGAIQNAKDLSFPAPVGYFGAGAVSHPAHVGDTLTIYAIGLGPTNPAVGTNAPAPGSEPLARLTVTPQVQFGSGLFGTFTATPSYAGLSPGSVGLYQVNVAIPAGIKSGTIAVTLVFPDGESNIAQIAVQ